MIKLNEIFKNKKVLIKILIGIVSLSLLFVSILFILDFYKGGPVGDGKKIFELSIQNGEGSQKIAKKLYSNGLIRSSNYFLFLLKMRGQTNRVQQGIFELKDNMSTRKIISSLVDGKVKMVSFTIPEGFHNRQIAELLTNKGMVTSKDEFLTASTKKEILEKYKIPAKTTEGYLFPDTYFVPYYFNAEKIVITMLNHFFKNLERIEKAKNNKPEEIHKKVILASIVEREAKKDEERPLMAGVFLKRIQKNIALESCATVQYLFEKPKKRLFERDLEVESPYNTYKHKGYPPGAISNPGFEALDAAYNPIETDYLFFLVKPDGSHYFSKTAKEHIQAKKKYIDVLYQ